MTMQPIVLTVGNCFADQASLERLLLNEFAVQVEHCDSTRDVSAKLELQSAALILINRIFDRDGSTGLELIAELKADPRYNSIPVMLLSNYTQYQEEAVRLGAEPGFGKGELRAAATLEKLARFLPTDKKHMLS